MGSRSAIKSAFDGRGANVKDAGDSCHGPGEGSVKPVHVGDDAAIAAVLSSSTRKRRRHFVPTPDRPELLQKHDGWGP